MRIAYVAPFGLRAKGTARARVLPLAQAVAARGHRAALFVPPYDSPEDSGLCWRDGAVPVFNAPLLPRASGRGPSGGLAQLRLAGSLLAAVCAWRPDLVHVFKPKGPSGLVGSALWLAWRLRSRLPGGSGFRDPANLRLGPILVVDSDDWEGAGGWNDDPRAAYSPAQRAVFAWQERYGLAHADAWTVVSRCLAERALSFGAAPERVCLLPNGISPSWLDATRELARDDTSRTPSVLLYTRFAGVRVPDVVAIWQAVRQWAPEATLTVVGRGLGGEEAALAAALPGVRASGWLEPAVMPRLFAAQALAIVPWADTPGNRARHSAKVLELMAAGLPVVAYAVGELPATMAETGVLVPPGDAVAFGRAVAALLANPARAAGLGAAARRRVEAHFTWDHLAGRALAFYNQVEVALDNEENP